jgi:D-alanyl-D-alanine carboxypeptidase
MIERNRVVRTIFGIAFTIIFAIFAYISCRVSPHSSEVDPSSPTYDGFVYGYDRYNYILSGRSVPPVQDTTYYLNFWSHTSDTPSFAPIQEPTISENTEVAPVEEVQQPETNPATLRAQEKGLPAPPNIDITSWEFMLANGDNTINEYEPPEITYLEEIPLDSRIVEPIKAMVEDARNQGLNVYLSSGYRSYSEQAANFVRVCENNGITDGKNAEGYYITVPAGCSEHQTGLACDITDVYYPIKDESIANTETYQYMSQHCQDFGFIVRYPEEKREITGIMYEPWHYRYVGVEVAKYITENHLCLEEFLDLYTPGILKAENA